MFYTYIYIYVFNALEWMFLRLLSFSIHIKWDLKHFQINHEDIWTNMEWSVDDTERVQCHTCQIYRQWYVLSKWIQENRINIFEILVSCRMVEWTDSMYCSWFLWEILCWKSESKRFSSEWLSTEWNHDEIKSRSRVSDTKDDHKLSTPFLFFERLIDLLHSLIGIAYLQLFVINNFLGPKTQLSKSEQSISEVQWPMDNALSSWLYFSDNNQRRIDARRRNSSGNGW